MPEWPAFRPRPTGRPFHVKHSYWTGVRYWSTSNSQLTANGWVGSVAALRLPTDTYVRSIWWAQANYVSDGTGPNPGWWAAANVFFVAQFDALGVLTHPASISSTEPPNRVAMGGGYSRRWSMPEYPPTYTVSWECPAGGIETGTGRRKGDGVHMPKVWYAVIPADQNNYFNLGAEPAAIVRCSIYGRVLWESDNP